MGQMISCLLLLKLFQVMEMKLYVVNMDLFTILLLQELPVAKVITAASDNLNVSCKNILKMITKKTKIIFFANPNNPTGTIIFKDKLESFLEKVPKNIIVVLDGAYSEFITDKRYDDGIDLIDKFQNLIITRTFSKIFALAGLRLG